MPRKPAAPVRDSWSALSALTPARIALGRVGASLPTAAMLDFSMAHARARDAIHAPLDTGALVAQLEAVGFDPEVVTSQARSRAEYLLRPDLGRRLATPVASAAGERLLTVVVGDGLSSLAPQRHAVALLTALRERVTEWVWDRVFVATEARVALGDGVGEARGSEAVLMLIGERPGLQASDSLGVYLTYRPRVGCTDADRNCVSNIRVGGLGYDEAAGRLAWLLREARLLGVSGVELKDDSDAEAKTVLPDGPTARGAVTS